MIIASWPTTGEDGVVVIFSPGPAGEVELVAAAFTVIVACFVNLLSEVVAVMICWPAFLNVALKSYLPLSLTV